MAGTAAETVMTSVSGIRGLSPEQVRQEVPVVLRGIVTYSNPAIMTLFVHDGEMGIFVECPGGSTVPALVPGDRVEVSGVTGEGLFATVIKCLPVAGIRVLEHGDPPPPVIVTGTQLARPDMDCAWISIECRIDEVRMREGDLVFKCRAGFYDFGIALEGPVQPTSVPWELAETTVRVCGVVATEFNTTRQMTHRFIRVSSLSDIVPVHGIPDRTAPLPLVLANKFFQVDGPGPDDLVRINGVATAILPGSGFFLRTGGGGIWIQTAEPIPVVAGALVEAEGWPGLGKSKPFLRARRSVLVAYGAPPEPVLLPAKEALQILHDSELVSVDAELLDVVRSEEGLTLDLRDTGIVFRGVLGEVPPGKLQSLVPGSRLRITGIASVITSGAFTPLQDADKLLIRLRSASDLQLLSPPPRWTARNVSIAALVLFAVLLAFLVVARSRKRAEQETQRREFEAVLSERGRFAREIHDSLAQGLTSISLQLECIRDEIVADPVRARSHIEMARGLVRDSLKEARRTVWNLRPLALGETDLIGAFQTFANELTRSGKFKCVHEIEGTPVPLPAGHEAALLRIGQEALTNAARHATPSEIRVKLRFGPGWVTVSVRDDGCGFDVSDLPAKGFGLRGMHERVAALGGSLLIDSIPDEGTEVSATLPT